MQVDKRSACSHFFPPALTDLHAALATHSTTPTAALYTASTTALSTAITALSASLNVILPDALITTLSAALAPTTLETFSNAFEAGAPCSQHCLSTSEYAHVTLWKTQLKPGPGHVHPTLYQRNPTTKPITHQKWLISKKPFFTNTPPNLLLPHLEVQHIFIHLLSTKHKYQGTITRTTAIRSVVHQYQHLVHPLPQTYRITYNGRCIPPHTLISTLHQHVLDLHIILTITGGTSTAKGGMPTGTLTHTHPSNTRHNPSAVQSGRSSSPLSQTSCSPPAQWSYQSSGKPYRPKYLPKPPNLTPPLPQYL